MLGGWISDVWIYLLIIDVHLLNAPGTRAQFESNQGCFCKSTEGVDDCRCDGSSVDEFNNYRVYPLLQKLLQKDFFRFYKVNMEKSCPFWLDERECMSKECGIGYCDDEVPLALKQPATISVITTASKCQKDGGGTDKKTGGKKKAVHGDKNSNDKDDDDDEDFVDLSNKFDPLDKTLSENVRQQLDHMDWHDENEHKFCDFDDETAEDMHYVDLSRNPERYTGYKGNSAQKVWQSIYRENCFKPNMKYDKNFLIHPNSVEGLCLEKRVFYRLISGLHSAITVSIASYNFKPALSPMEEGKWFRNIDMFRDRFGTKWTWEGPERLKNVYFVYLLELRALVKVTPYLRTELFYTGNKEQDTETKAAVEELMGVLKEFKDPFDETEMFTGVEAQARELREEFRLHFHNISRIMDCVGCDKCRLWGKLQIHGMGTALKILFSDLPTSHYITKNDFLQAPFQLTRNEVVSLFQSFGRYSSSIREVEEFRQVLFK